MALKGKNGQMLFYASLGLAIGSAFCMKWMEPDLQVNGDKFSIIALELFYPRHQVQSLLSSLDDKTRTILSYHLYFDFAFMTGIFPFLFSLCSMAGQRVNHKLPRTLLQILAWLQLLAWGLDIFENTRLLRWLERPFIYHADFFLFRLVVGAKWVIAITGLVIATGYLLGKRNKRKD